MTTIIISVTVYNQQFKGSLSTKKCSSSDRSMTSQADTTTVLIGRSLSSVGLYSICRTTSIPDNTLPEEEKHVYCINL